MAREVKGSKSKTFFFSLQMESHYIRGTGSFLDEITSRNEWESRSSRIRSITSRASSVGTIDVTLTLYISETLARSRCFGYTKGSEVGGCNAVITGRYI